MRPRRGRPPFSRHTGWLRAREPKSSDYLDEGIFHIEPTQNPDGRDRFAHWANMNRAEPFVADRLDREHNEVWPGGRTNHYWFDLNRDWLPLVNPESQGPNRFPSSMAGQCGHGPPRDGNEQLPSSLNPPNPWGAGTPSFPSGSIRSSP